MSIDAIRARWAGVGPWRFDDDSDVMWIERRGTRKRVCWNVYAAADARRIDAAPADIAALLAALDSLTAERDKWLRNFDAAMCELRAEGERLTEAGNRETALRVERDAALARVAALEAALAVWYAPGDMALDDWYKGRPERGAE